VPSLTSLATMVDPKRSPAATTTSAKRRNSPSVLLLLPLLASSSSSSSSPSAVVAFSPSSHVAGVGRRPRWRLLHDVASSYHAVVVRRTPLASSLVGDVPSSDSSPPLPVVYGSVDDIIIPDGAIGDHPAPPSNDPSLRRRHRWNADAIVNFSILTFIGLITLERVLSVDVGITRGWSPSEIAERLPLDNWASYSHVLNVAPIRTKALTSATVYAMGDVLSQRSSGVGMGEIDRYRVLRSLLAGLIGHGPMSHVWYHVSEDFFDNVIQLKHVWYDFVPKVILDQLIFGPIWNNSYILLLGMMQLHSPGRIWDDMRRTTLPLLLSGLRLWPFVHIITYGVMPVENRLLWVDAVEIVWVTILASTASSTTTSGPSEEEEEEEKEKKEAGSRAHSEEE
jgi:protein Mpv17